MARLNKLKRSLSVTESAVVTSLTSNWIDFKVKDTDKGLILIFSSDEKLDYAKIFISDKLRDNNFDFSFDGYEEGFVLNIWKEKIFLQANKLWFLNKIKNWFIKLFITKL